MEKRGIVLTTLANIEYLFSIFSDFIVLNFNIYDVTLELFCRLSIACSDLGVNLLRRPLLGRLAAVFNGFHL